MFKKGNKVTLVLSCDSTGSVNVRHFIVSSWGKKRGTLICVDDGSNAEFRVYTQDANHICGIRSSRIIATADYSDELALKFAAEFIDDENARAEARWARAQARHQDPACIPYGVTKDRELEFERNLYNKHKAVAWRAAIK